jgi:hypothetical protein
VESFRPAVEIDGDDNHELNSHGNQVVVLQAIDTRSLVFSHSPMELLGSYSFICSLAFVLLSLLLLLMRCLAFAGKMSNMRLETRLLLLKASKKVAG